jgi:uroporphyrinogen-III synthase
MIYLLSPLYKEGTIPLPMIDFKLHNVALETDSYDLLMFTSKQAVVSAEALNPRWKEIPCLAIGKATANQIEKLGGNVVYHPESFYGESLAQDIIKRFKEKKILYIRPKVVSFDSKTFLAQSGIVLDEKIIYETICQKYTILEKPHPDAIIIFTSPSTIHCFLDNFGWDESYIAIVIGEATKVHLPKHVKVFVADKPLISECIVKAKEVLTANQL